LDIIDTDGKVIGQYLGVKGGTVTGEANFTGRLLSGGTDLSSLFIPNNGSGGGFFTGGTVTGPTNFISTISSGGTDLSAFFSSPRVVTAITANVTALNNHRYMCSASTAPIAITLPLAANSSNYEVILKKIDNSVYDTNVITSGSDTLDGFTGATLSTQYESITVNCDGLNWYII
jgi:hypothetical protein